MGDRLFDGSTSTMMEPARRARRLPVVWARFGPASRLLARRIPPRQPPVLVLAFPRSGSSWVGETLGSARDALYLREPINLSLNRDDPTRQDVTTVVDEGYRRYAELAFMGLPAFPRSSVSFPWQWGLFRRRRRRLVVKEINLLAAPWLMARWQPRVILLVRHPAPVALSFRRVGWAWDSLDGARLLAHLPPDLPLEWVERLRAARGYWEQHATFHAAVLRLTVDALGLEPGVRVVRFEDVAADPTTGFRQLFEFAGLTWDGWSERVVKAKSREGDRGKPFSTSRDSARMIEGWRQAIDPEDLRRVRMGYAAFDLPWYRDPQEW